MNVILISRLGPALMKTEDLKATFYNSEDLRVQKRYYIGETYYSLENFVYHSDAKTIPLLRPRPKLKQSDYISQYLKEILT